MNYKVWKCPGVLALLALGAACAPTPAPITTAADGVTVSWPAAAWPVSTPEAEGIDPAAIDSLVRDLEAGVYGLVDAFMLIRHGRVVADHRWEHDYDSIAAAYDTTNYQYNYDHPDWHPYYRDTDLHTLQSVTKSVTSAALGIAIDEGLIAGVDVPVMPYFEAYAPFPTDERKESITLEDLLTMRSGLSWYTEGGYANEEHSTVVMEKSDEWIRFILDQPNDTTPGTHFEYNDGVSVLIGKILREATGQRADEWARERLFEPIGIDAFYWKITPDGEADTEGGLYLATEDLARIGYLFLRGGRWNGRQVISREWVEASVAPVVPDIAPANGRQDQGYGYQWWIPAHQDGVARLYGGNGYGGQFVWVYPQYDLVIVYNGWNIHPGDYQPVWSTPRERIVPALIGER